ncbi:MAG: BtpA/SgcQ family protein [Anaerolineaceae bacterium]|nr:BtpA/SgcQ family protein [Anaerolineaceae bacterium]
MIDKFGELERIFGTRKPIIGMVHLAPLPGSPRYDGMSMQEITDLALVDARMLKEAGVDGAIVENFGDVMFYKRVPAETIAAMTYVAANIAREVPGLTLGMCVLQSDAIAGMAIANTVGAKFIRVPYYTETYVVDAGLMDSIAAETLRYRKFLNADVKIFADVHIKHGYPLSQRPIGEAAADAEHRGLADAILVTGIATGAQTKADDVKEVKESVKATPVFVASGVDEKNLPLYKKYADGAILGTHIKVNEDTEAPIDPKKLSAFMKVARTIWPK